ncbi:lysophospholipid acyltransferase family protein [Fibrobacter sp.]|uniref:lysophospholipid acyltransferase family protein n=1 Tax=Fibrobacter sp. TaxID=35828 RepID=UPI00388E8E19
MLANLRHIGFAENAANKAREGFARVGGDVAYKAREKMYCRLLRNLVRHVGELLFCFKTFKKLPADLGAYPCRVHGWNFDLAPGSAEILEKMRHGGIFLTAHYGNYEAMGPWLCRLGIPLVASYIPVKPAWLNRILEGRIRAVDGCSYSVNARTPREFVRLLQDGKLFCLLADQDSRIASAQEGLFMGKSVHNNPLPEFLLKHRPETPVFVCWIEENSTRILHAEEIPMQFAAAGAASVMARFNAWLQSRIVENPALWYGFTHRRFYSKNPEMYK